MGGYEGSSAAVRRIQSAASRPDTPASGRQSAASASSRQAAADAQSASREGEGLASSDDTQDGGGEARCITRARARRAVARRTREPRSEEHTSELQSLAYRVC